MAISPRFQLLTSRCLELRQRFLPAAFSATGVYSDEEFDKARAYRLLVHAEMESFLEDRVKETTVEAVTNWKTSARMSPPLLGLLSYAKTLSVLPTTLPARGPKTLLEGRLDEASNGVFGTLRNNNGVRIKNLLPLLLSAGIQETDLDPIWLNDMDAFGVDRGAIAHNSSVSSLTTHSIDPATELSRVGSLLQGIENIDLRLNAFFGR